MEIFLAINDFCLTPLLSMQVEQIKVTIGLGHDFDDILEVTAGHLSNEQIAHIHKLWSDDSFPREFKRLGDELLISERKI